jgi:hypothetical protein
MKMMPRVLAALEMLLVFPAVLFMASLFTRSIQPTKYEPAHTAQVIVDWYAARPHLGLWVLLGVLPMAVLLIGVAILVREWRRDEDLRDSARMVMAAIRSHAAALMIAGATAAAGCILAIVALHVITG